MSIICPVCGFAYDGINPHCLACGRPFFSQNTATVKVTASSSKTKSNGTKSTVSVNLPFGLSFSPTGILKGIVKFIFEIIKSFTG
jgi:hypothetical protein